MSVVEAPRLLLDRQFVDMDEYAKQVGWDLDFRQIEAGRLNARAALIAASRSAAIRVEFDRAFHQAGSPPGGLLTFGLPDPEVGEFRWCGARASGGDMLNFNLASGFDGASRAGFSGYTLSFTEELLCEVQKALGLDFNLGSRVSESAVWTEARHVTTQLRRRLAAAYRATATRPDGCTQAGELFDFTAASLILQFVAGEGGRKSTRELSLRRRAVRTAMAWLEKHERVPLTVSELCRQAGVSPPTLYRGFQEELGIGPKRYLHVRRLSGVRRALSRATRGARIVDVANRWGFWHMGQFAADYREHFGELPSETLRRATDGVART